MSQGAHTEGVTASDYLAPLFALIAVGGLGILGRWVFAPNYRKHRKDYGLLVAVATITDQAEAERARAALMAAGMRATLGESHATVRVTSDGHAFPQPPGHHVLVFPQDELRARNVLDGVA